MEKDDVLAVSVEHAAKITGIGRTGIFEAIRKKELASLKAGKRRLVRMEALREWLRRLEEAS
jgi:excisionase family DNA binding protein